MADDGLDVADILLDQRPFRLALGGAAERIESRAAKPPHPRQHPEDTEDPRSEGDLRRPAGPFVEPPGEQRRRQPDLDLARIVEARRDPGPEGRIGMEPGDLVLVLVGHHLVEHVGDRLGQPHRARPERGIRRAHPLDQGGVARRIGGVLIGGQVVRQPADLRLERFLRRLVPAGQG